MTVTCEPAIALRLVFWRMLTGCKDCLHSNGGGKLKWFAVHFPEKRKMSDFEDEEGVDEPILDADEDEEEQILEEV